MGTFANWCPSDVLEHKFPLGTDARCISTCLKYTRLAKAGPEGSTQKTFGIAEELGFHSTVQV